MNAIGTATPIRLKLLHANEVICTHQTGENSFITICTLDGRLVSLCVHVLSNNNGENNKEKSDNINSIIPNGNDKGTAVDLNLAYQSQKSNDSTEQDLMDGKYKVLFMTPEHLDSAPDLLKCLNDKLGINLLAIDECHCVR